MLATEIMNYFKVPTNDSVQILHKFPTVKQIFLKFNSIHTSEADVERIFSYAGISNSNPIFFFICVYRERWKFQYLEMKSMGFGIFFLVEF